MPCYASQVAFGRRFIPVDGVGHRSNISDILTLTVLPAGRLINLNANS